MQSLAFCDLAPVLNPQRGGSATAHRCTGRSLPGHNCRDVKDREELRRLPQRPDLYHTVRNRAGSLRHHAHRLRHIGGFKHGKAGYRQPGRQERPRRRFDFSGFAGYAAAAFRDHAGNTRLYSRSQYFGCWSLRIIPRTN
jgi:hypothetical protein